MPITVFRLRLRKSEIKLDLVGEAEQRFGEPFFPYLMSCFFGKTYFLFEFHNATLTQGAVYRVNLHDLKIRYILGFYLFFYRFLKTTSSPTATITFSRAEDSVEDSPRSRLRLQRAHFLSANSTFCASSPTL